MSTPVPISPGRYRRRILGLGGLAFVVTFAIGAAIFVPVVQNDLEDRVEDELAEAGLEGVSASFSGQDGTLSCAAPLDEPDAAEALAEDVHGVRVIDLDRTCSDGSSAADDTATDAPADTASPDTEPSATTPPTTEAPPTTVVETTTTTQPAPAEPDPDSVVGIVDADPLFSVLADALVTAGLEGEDALGGDGPFTLLAPTDAAFDAAFEELDADAFIAFTSDPEALRAVLLHHATDGAITSSDFVAGDLEMLDGTTVAVDPEADGGITFTSNGSSSGVEDPDTQLDIEASNGVVHAIDRLLIPDGFVIGGAGVDATTTTASWTGGQMTLSGVVQTDEQRSTLIAAAEAAVDPANVADGLSVDPDAELDEADLDRLSELLSAVPANLAVGEASLVGADLTLSGTYLNDDAQAAVEQAAADQEATLELAPRDAADADAAAALQAELNEFVTDNPILFEPNSAVLTADATAILDQVAVRALRLDGTSITVVGHTDSDGDPATNQALSQGRAGNVMDELASRGVDATLTSEGRGSTEPVLDESGAEDKAASRRVEFVVEAT